MNTATATKQANDSFLCRFFLFVYQIYYLMYTFLFILFIHVIEIVKGIAIVAGNCRIILLGKYSI